MGTPIPKKQREQEMTGAGPLTVMTFDQLDPKTQAELREKYGIKIGEQPVEVEEKVDQSIVEERGLLTKELYLRLSVEQPDYKIANEFNISTQMLKRFKDEWEIPDRRLHPAKPLGTDIEKPKNKPGRPKSKPPAEFEKKEPVKKTGKQPETSHNFDAVRLIEMENELQEKDREIGRLRAENKKLQDMYENQIEEIQEADVHAVRTLLQDFLQFTFVTKNAAAADNARRTLQQLGSDLDYRVRRGVIEVTTDIGTTETVLAPHKGADSHADTSIKN
ncbi:hypothetical protein [Brevibacillus invocatus]|uniref:hypothetical protein n=1 Tax=Brevibacillus invocatus TaxID=173959 RepID=UPI00203DC1AD|nr:hypothetical protein [Brevibacillus invocatus]MCM3079618.1 hypothetical protein [Brevibacillus invocatus]MCM3429816.1 hypothetical protein [Brevibacillus invocatus]